MIFVVQWSPSHVVAVALMLSPQRPWLALLQ